MRMSKREVSLLVTSCVGFVAIMDLPMWLAIHPPVWAFFVAPPLAFMLCRAMSMVADGVVSWAREGKNK